MASDEEKKTEKQVFWGPLTIDEIKHFLYLERDPKIINRRVTLCNSQPSALLPVSNKLNDHFELDSNPISDFKYDDADKEVLIHSSSSTSNSNSNFIEQLSEVLNLNGTNVCKAEHRLTKSSQKCESIIVISSDDESFDENEKVYIISDNSSFEIASNAEKEPNELKNFVVKSEPLASNTLCPKIKICDDLEYTTDDSELDLKPASNNDLCSQIFNDTLEEMEKALQYGLDYSMSTSESEINENIKHLSLDFHQKNNNDLKQNNTSTPSKSIDESPTVSNAKHKSPKIHFKTPDFRNIFSPVGFYIRNSPRTPQVQHIPAKKYFPKSLCFNVNNKENLKQDLPQVTYKPPKYTVTNKENSQPMPRKIEQLLPSPVEVIKHNCRVNKNAPQPSLEELMDRDLTINCTSSVDISKFSNTSDTSILTLKKTYIK